MKFKNNRKITFIIGIFMLVASIIVSAFILTTPKNNDKKAETQNQITQNPTTQNDAPSKTPSTYGNLMKSFNENVPEFYYHYKDIDGNGVYELLILENCALYIYTYDDNGVRQIGSHDFVTGTLQFLESQNYDGIFVFTQGGSCDNYRYLTLIDGNITIAEVCKYDYTGDRAVWVDINENKELIAEVKKVSENNDIINFTQYLPIDFQGNDAVSFVCGTNKYIAVVEFEETVAKNLKIYDDTTKDLLQTIPLNRSEDLPKTDRSIYAADINFDGYLDILIPDMHPARAIFYNAYIYNTKQQKFIEAPSFKNLPNPALDTKNRRVLHSSSGDSIMSFGMGYYDDNTKDFVPIGSISISPKNDQYHFVEYSYKDGKERSIKNEFYVPLHEYYLIPKQNPDVVPYYEDGGLWELDSDKWDKLVTTVETDFSVDTTPSDNPLSLDEVKNIFEPLLKKAVEVEQTIINNSGTFQYEEEIAFRYNQSDYSLITDPNFQRLDSVWNYTYTAFTMDAAHRAFSMRLDQETPSPRFLEKDGKLYYNRNGHGYNSTFDILSLKIVNQFKNTIIVSINDHEFLDESTSYTCIFILQNTENGWRFANTQEESYKINTDNYLLKLVAENENQQPAIDAFTSFLNGKASAKDVTPNKPSQSKDYIYIFDLNCRNITLSGIDAFTLFDLNDDGIPELITEGYTINVFSYDNGELKAIYETPAGSSSQKYLLANKKIYWSLATIGVSYEIASFDKDLSVTIETYFDGKTEQEGDEEIFYHNEDKLTESEFYKLMSEFMAPHFFTPPDTVWYAYNTPNNSLSTSRDIGEMQPETQEIITIDGKCYQSYVASNVDIRYVWITEDEVGEDKPWGWFTVGTNKFYSLLLLDKVNEGRQ